MQFDVQGNLLRAWGGAVDPGFLSSRCTPAMGCEWPTNEHGIFVDHKSAHLGPHARGPAPMLRRPARSRSPGPWL